MKGIQPKIHDNTTIGHAFNRNTITVVIERERRVNMRNFVFI